MGAEDLNVANILTSDFTRDRAEFEGKLNTYSSGKSLIYVNQEFRSDHFGHMCLLNLKQLIEPVATRQPYAYPLHAQVCDRIHAQGGYVSWAHFPSMPGLESPLGGGRKTSLPTRRQSMLLSTANRSGVGATRNTMLTTMQHAIDWLKAEARFASAEDRKSSIAAFEQASLARAPLVHGFGGRYPPRDFIIFGPLP
jgi:hypothetical protein